MLGLHIATMHYECHESSFVMEVHEFDLNLMVWTIGFTHCYELSQPVTMCYDLLHEFLSNLHESLRTVTNTVLCCCNLLSAIANFLDVYMCYILKYVSWVVASARWTVCPRG